MMYLCIGLRRQSSSYGISLLVISFSVINYVVSMSGPRASVDDSSFL